MICKSHTAHSPSRSAPHATEKVFDAFPYPEKKRRWMGGEDDPNSVARKHHGEGFEIVSFEMGLLMFVALLGLYVGFGILIVVYRLIQRME